MVLAFAAPLDLDRKPYFVLHICIFSSWLICDINFGFSSDYPPILTGFSEKLLTLYSFKNPRSSIGP